MSLRIRMGLALIFAVTAVVVLIVTGPEYLSAVHASLGGRSASPPPAPVLLRVASYIGLGGWLLVVHQQFRRRQIGWLVASFLTSYLGVIVYSALNLLRRPHDAPA